MRIALRPAITCLLLLTACGRGENDPGPGAVTVGEARALDEAAEILEERRLAPDDLRKVPAVDTAPESSQEESGARGNADR